MKYKLLNLKKQCQGSLPSRERGLKFVNRDRVVIPKLSLPSRERGLKFDRSVTGYALWKSLPSRERGLKLDEVTKENIEELVAPFAGAWIEIVL